MENKSGINMKNLIVVFVLSMISVVNCQEIKPID
jgi:hypothetical protein